MDFTKCNSCNYIILNLKTKAITNLRWHNIVKSIYMINGLMVKQMLLPHNFKWQQISRLNNKGRYQLTNKRSG